ncbi:MAG TPA: beta-ketoacyl-[acyl-carrier-protein] synthase family protein [Anaerolineales bacterium]|nr:beta-ketoacyl-[acyl-carrier-protein] synthase family protein [Anaerolineales bacterium]
MNRVVITGIGIASPLGCTIDTFWQNILAGQSGIGPLEGEDFENLPVRIGARVCDYNPDDHFDRKETRRMSLSSQFAIVAAKQAIIQAVLESGNVNSVEVGVMIGSSIGGFAASDPVFRDYYQRGRKSAMVIPLSMNYGPSANVSIRYGFQGPLFTVDAACASAAHSIGYAYNLIRTGQLDIAVTGGADSPFSTGVMEAWATMKALSTRNDDPAEASRPFSLDRDGMVLGEGAGILVVESAESAIQRGVPILAEIKGYGASGDSYHITRPSQQGPALAMQRALKDAGLTTEQIDLINAHATATQQNDSTETAAIKTVFGKQAYHIPIIGLKGALGHSIAASSGIQAVSCILALRDQIAPPTLNVAIPDPACDLDYVAEGARQVTVNQIMSNAFAFGGSNAVLVIGKYRV